MIPGMNQCDLIWKKVLCRYNEVKDLEMRRPSWIIQVGPKFNDKRLCKRHTEEIDRKGGCNVTTEKEIGVATS